MPYFSRIPELPLEPPEPEVFCKCCRCQEDICIGEEYVNFDGETYCMECFMDDAATILLENYGAEKHIAENDRWGEYEREYD